MARERTPNTKLAELIAETGWSYAAFAAAFVRVASENGATQFAAVGKVHIFHWTKGTVPSDGGPQLLCETLSRRLRRPVSLENAGFGIGADQGEPSSGWDVDTLAALADLRRIDIQTRRDLLSAATYQVAALAVPPMRWWQSTAEDATTGRRPSGRHLVDEADLEAVIDTTKFITRMDQRLGGGHARTMAGTYLTTDVAELLNGPFISDHVRRAMFSAAAELAYVGGWTRFDNAEHGPALRYFQVAAKLAAEAGDAPLAGHILRAMAHQAVDLGHAQRGLRVAEASIAGERYLSAVPRERALLGIVHAKALGATGDSRAATAALLQAENDLANATPGDTEPDRVFFFGEASLAMETACTLRDLGDLQGAEESFRRSVALRKADTFTRTHAVTLGYLGTVQIRRGLLEEACDTWGRALDAAEKVYSGRTRAVAGDIRRELSPFRKRGSRVAAVLDCRAQAFLATAH
jgi:hypothetical protein